jgi:hypothetical protein
MLGIVQVTKDNWGYMPSMELPVQSLSGSINPRPDVKYEANIEYR